MSFGDSLRGLGNTTSEFVRDNNELLAKKTDKKENNNTSLFTDKKENKPTKFTVDGVKTSGEELLTQNKETRGILKGAIDKVKEGTKKVKNKVKEKVKKFTEEFKEFLFKDETDEIKEKRKEEKEQKDGIYESRKKEDGIYKTAEKENKSTKYIVKKGDNLWKIAEKALGKNRESLTEKDIQEIESFIAKIVKENNINNPEIIKPKQISEIDKKPEEERKGTKVSK